MLPDDVTMLTTRLALRGSSEPELLAMLTDLDQAASLLGHAEPDAIAFHCTAVSTFAPHLAAEIRDRITAATGLPGARHRGCHPRRLPGAERLAGVAGHALYSSPCISERSIF